MALNYAYASVMTYEDQCLCLEVYGEDSRAFSQLAPGGGLSVPLADAIYRRAKDMDWSNPERFLDRKVADRAFRDLLDGVAKEFGSRRQKTGQCGDSCSMRLADAVLYNIRQSIHVTFRLDVTCRILYVSGGAGAEEPELALPFDMPPDLYRALMDAAPHVGFSLGTMVRTWQRTFQEPWANLDRCLNEPDPVLALRKAAQADVLADKLWVETGSQHAENGLLTVTRMVNSAHGSGSKDGEVKKTLGLSVPGVFGPGTRAMLYFCMQEDGSVSLMLPTNCKNWDQSAVQTPTVKALSLRTQKWRRLALRELADQVAADATGAALDRLRRVTAAVYLTETVFAHGWKQERGGRLAAWYARSLLTDRAQPDDPAIPVPAVGVTVKELDAWIQNTCGWQNCMALRRNEHRRGEDFLALRPDGGWDTVSADRVWTRAADTCAQVMTQTPIGEQAFELLVKLGEALPDLCSLDQTAYLVQPERTGRVLAARLDNDGAGFLLQPIYPDDPDTPVRLEEALARGETLCVNDTAVEMALRDSGRKTMAAFGIVGNYDFYTEAEEAAVAELKKDQQGLAELLLRYSIPDGWSYALAQFEDGLFGVTYGPRLDGEADDDAKERLHDEAQTLPSSAALLLFDL